ncbi:MAG: ferritin-like domain-containing protein [Alphaproteobacteria bacterium]|nr:MAG: ferritin-like domain-containing protein [Alphaproteobacteria bacterium]
MFTGTPEVGSLQDLFLEQLKDVYDAEHRILESLPVMGENTTSVKLRQAFEKHQTQTETHVERLEQIFDMMGLEPERRSCDAIKGLVKEGDEVMSEAEGNVLDAGLIASAQAVEHYEIARYGTLKTWAETLGMREAARLLDSTLKEEIATDQLLSQIAEDTVNPAAFSADLAGKSKNTGSTARR